MGYDALFREYVEQLKSVLQVSKHAHRTRTYGAHTITIAIGGWGGGGLASAFKPPRLRLQQGTPLVVLTVRCVPTSPDLCISITMNGQCRTITVNAVLDPRSVYALALEVGRGQRYNCYNGQRVITTSQLQYHFVVSSFRHLRGGGEVCILTLRQTLPE